MGDGDADHLTLPVERGEGGLLLVDPEIYRPADELRVGIEREGPRDQAGLGQDLGTVAYPEHQFPALCMGDDLGHHWCPGGNGPGPEVVTVGEAPGNDHGIVAPRESVLVPDKVAVNSADF